MSRGDRGARDGTVEILPFDAPARENGGGFNRKMNAR